MSRNDVERDLPMHGPNTDPGGDLAAEIARTFTLNFALRFGAAMSSRCGSPDVLSLRDQLVQKFLATAGGYLGSMVRGRRGMCVARRWLSCGTCRGAGP
jgi:hypothetical protein